MSDIVWISLNEGVFAGVSDRCRKEISEYMRNGHQSNRPCECRRCPAINPPLFQRGDLIWTLDPQKIFYISAVAPSQGNVHSAPVFRHLVAVRLITSNAATGKGIVFVDSGDIPRDCIRGGRGYRIRMDVLSGT